MTDCKLRLVGVSGVEAFDVVVAGCYFFRSERAVLSLQVIVQGTFEMLCPVYITWQGSLK